jgi:hypothetical protein
MKAILTVSGIAIALLACGTQPQTKPEAVKEALPGQRAWYSLRILKRRVRRVLRERR